MDKKIKGALTFVLLATLSLGGIAYFSSGFSNWNADDWRDRLTPVSSEEPPVSSEEPPVSSEEPPVSSEEPPVSSEEPYEEFTTFETDAYFNDAFGDLDGYTIGESQYLSNGCWEIDYGGELFIYYGFPIYYDVFFIGSDLSLYYSNDYYNFYLNNLSDGEEGLVTFGVDNYIGSEDTFYFGRLNSSAMAIYIENEPVLTDS